MKKALFFGCLFLIVCSCSDYNVRRQLIQADSLCTTNADSSISIIRELQDNVGEWHESDRIYANSIYNRARIKNYCEKSADRDSLKELFEEQASVLNESHQRAERFVDTMVAILFVLFVLFGLFLLYFILHQKADKRRIRYLLYMNDRKSDQIKSLKEETSEWISKRNQRQQELAASPEMATMRKRCANRECPTTDEWEHFQIMMDTLFSSFVQQLISVFHLSTQEIRVCLLVKAQFKPMEIAILTAHSKEAITSTRRRLYKKITGKSGTPEQLDKLIMEW
ncbi:MAG: hypothetical protein K6G30_13425 [Acetatifactor sp.]|nr:hypothetical protein [Acetatifactor sp.]